MIYKCKMCGGSFEIAEGMTVCECEYCGTPQTLPRSESEQMLNMFNRANHFRQQCEFDKAAEIYERMTAQSDDPEVYWSIVLCRYGIEYVDDPLTKKKIPTCHRTQYKSILDDADYKTALEHADTLQRSIYEEEARYIDTVQKGILEISNKEQPFDVFICYKESDENGRRTPDSVLAQELYYGLVNEGFKVFFSRITLESKLGTEYEPYIFAALNSAKVMVVVGTKPEYFNAVWVKNEWSRYLMLMQNDRSRTLIPAYKDMDPYDLPDALSMFQAQDMSKLGFMQDLIRGISKIAKAETPQPTVVKETVVQSAPVNTNVAPLLKRASIFLGDGDWNSANEYCEKVLDIDPENAYAYLYKVLAKLHIISEDAMNKAYLSDFIDKSKYIENIPDFKKAYKFGDDVMKAKLSEFRNSLIYNGAVKAMDAAKTDDEYRHAAKGFEKIKSYKDSREKSAQCEECAKDYLYDQACKLMKNARTDQDFDKAAKAFLVLQEHKDSLDKIAECEERAKDYLYHQACTIMHSAKTADDYEKAAGMFISSRIRDFRDSKEQSKQCRTLADMQVTYDKADSKSSSTLYDEQNKAVILFESIENFKDSKDRAEQCREKALLYKARDKAEKRKQTIIKVSAVSSIVCVIFLVLMVTVIIPSVKYNNGVKAIEAGEYVKAIVWFEELGDYKDSADQLTLAQNSKVYDEALELKHDGRYGEAISKFTSLGSFKDSKENLKQAQILKIKSGDFSEGDTIVFGDYSWIVIEKTDNSALILAEDTLFKKYYNDKKTSVTTSVTWEECTLRKYLNKDFYNTFSKEEKAMIQEVTNENPNNEEYGTKGGNDTKDKIYLLSIDEANTLSSKTRDCSMWWWLRSPGNYSNNAAGVHSDGVIDTTGHGVYDAYGVRPAMTISWE